MPFFRAANFTGWNNESFKSWVGYYVVGLCERQKAANTEIEYVEEGSRSG